MTFVPTKFKSFVSSRRLCVHRLRQGFSLIEIIVVVGLLSLITLGLFAMFSQTQRVFRVGLTQVDVLEGGRNVSDMLTRELLQMRAGYQPGGVNFLTITNAPTKLLQALPGVPTNVALRVNIPQRLYFLTRENQTWTGIGYKLIDPETGNPATEIGTLYRYESSVNVPNSPATLYDNYDVAPVSRMSKVLDGVVHFKILAYNPNGVLVNSSRQNILAVPLNASATEVSAYVFLSNAIPATVEVEIGILEERANRRAKSIPAGPARQNYLRDQAGKVHIFRLRVPVHNVDSGAYS